MADRYALGALAGSAVLSSVFRSGTIRISGDQTYRAIVASGQPVIYALWHGRLLIPTWVHRGQGVTALISRSGDGEYIARLVERWGYHTARGSSSKGAQAGFREMIRAIRAGNPVTFTPDGPRGPRQKLKPGALVAAQLSGAPIIPVSAAATRAWWFEGWDRFLAPKPFSRMFVAYGAPVHVPRDASESDLRVIEAQVENTLNELTDALDAEAHG